MFQPPDFVTINSFRKGDIESITRLKIQYKETIGGNLNDNYLLQETYRGVTGHTEKEGV